MYKSHMGYSQNYGPFLVVDYISAPTTSGHQNKDPNLGNYPYGCPFRSQKGAHAVLAIILGAVSCHKALTKVKGNVRVYHVLIT